MKKFLIFLVSTIIIVCLGVTFYQFAKNDEVISVTGETIYINYGETLSLDDIGFSRKEASKDTKIDFNAGGDEVTSIIKYDEVTQSYIPTTRGGSTTIIISTTNSKYKRLAIDVIVGVGSEENPYYISNETQLFDIGNTFKLNSNFSLASDIELTKSHTPIGYNASGSDDVFFGTFNGNLHTISNLTIENAGNNAGLFAVIGSNATVCNLTLSNINISGNYDAVGAVAGTNYGTINRVTVENPNFNNTSRSKLTGTGGIVGVSNDNTGYTSPAITRCYVYSTSGVIKSAGLVGGIVGSSTATSIHACHTNVTLESSNYVGGIVGNFEVDETAYIRECYSISTVKGVSGCAGNFIGCISIEDGVASVNKALTLMGNYCKRNDSLPLIALDYSLLDDSSLDDKAFIDANDYTITAKYENELKLAKTYKYYTNSNDDVVYWDELWILEDGQYPVLASGNQSIIGNITPSNPSQDEEIVTPSNPSTDGKIISSKADLVKHLQSSTTVSGTYILADNIDLGGMIWAPVKFSGTFKGSNDIRYTISNFTINANDKNVGFFSVVGKATISNINFENVKITAGSSCSGVLAGIIQGASTITNVGIGKCTISNSSDYAGLLAGYTTNSIISITKCCSYTSTISGKNSNAGGLIAYVGANTTIKNCEAGNNISAINKLGGICAINYGTISYSYFKGNVSSVGLSNQGFFGGAVGVNHGTITDSSAYIDNMIVENTSLSNENISYLVGGFVGYNKGGIIKTCNVSADSINTGASTSRVYIGGICGYNTAELTESFASIDQIGTVNSTDCVAGIVAYNYGGKVSGCYILSDKLAGLIVAGLVISNSNNATIDSCYVGKTLMSRTVLTGKNIAGLAYDMVCGTVSNSLVCAELKGTNSDGYIAGFAMFLPYLQDKFGTITKSVANVSFSGQGYAYLITTQNGLLNKNQCTGSVIDCVISKDAMVSGINIPTRSTVTFIVWDIKTYAPGSGTNYAVATTQEIQSIDLYLNADLNFDISSSSNGNSKWEYFDNTRPPMPRQIYKAMKNIAG